MPPRSSSSRQAVHLGLDPGQGEGVRPPDHGHLQPLLGVRGYAQVHLGELLHLLALRDERRNEVPPCFPDDGFRCSSYIRPARPTMARRRECRFFDSVIGVMIPHSFRVAAGEDRFGEPQGLGVSRIDFKVTPQDGGGILILENTFHQKGGPSGICITSRRSGSTPLKGSSLSR